MANFSDSLYSKAARISRSLPQERGTGQQLLAMLKKQGVKPAELEHTKAMERFGNDPKVNREELAQHFEQGQPKIGEGIRSSTDYDTPMPKYEDYKVPGGENYREVLLHLLNDKPMSKSYSVKGAFPQTFDDKDQAETYVREWRELATREPKIAEALAKSPLDIHEFEKPTEGPEDYKSPHWDTPNVLAHLRYTDRYAHKPPSEKLAKAEEDFKKAKKLSDEAYLGSTHKKPGSLENFHNLYAEAQRLKDELAKVKREEGLAKHLHLEELQSDWGQEGRKRGFQAPEDKEVSEELKKAREDYANYREQHQAINDMRRNAGEQFTHEDIDKMASLMEKMIELDKWIRQNGGHENRYSGKAPPGPYVQNTQHWVDLGLKHALHEAAKGGYDYLSWTPGQEHVDRYGEENIEGEGMRKFYDEMLPKSLLKLAKQHDPEAKLEQFELTHPEEEGSDEDIQDKTTSMQRLPITDKMRESISQGQPSFAEGGPVDAKTGKFVREARADGGKVLSDAQKEAGNYKKDHISFQGIPVSIENPKGSFRRGKDKDGHEWKVKMPYSYGYVKRTEGADGDSVDVCIGPYKHSNSVFVVDQKDAKTGLFDEHKAMLGYDCKGGAERAYKAGFSDGKGHLRMGPITRMTIEEFKQWLKMPKETKTPNKSQELVDSALKKARLAVRKRQR